MNTAGPPPTGAQPSHAAPQTGPQQSGLPQRGTQQGAPRGRQHGQQGGYGEQQPHPPNQGGQHPPQHPTGTHRNPMNGPYESGAPPARGAPPGQDPRYRQNTGENPGFGGNTGPNPTFGASTGADSSFSSAHGNPQRSATGPHPNTPVQHGPHTDPTPRVGYVPPGSPAVRGVEDAVGIAQKEGSDFGDSIARDAPALWLEAVLARRPRMPSDLEARLLQGSTLPIDFLLHDAVRDALRNGFWDALERCRA